MNLGRILQFSPDWIWEAAPDGRFAYSSECCKSLLGYSPEELLTLSVHELATPEAATSLADIVRRQLSLPRVRHALRHKDGHVLDVETSSRAIFDTEGSYQGILAITRNRGDTDGDGALSLYQDIATDRLKPAVDGRSEPALRQRDALVREIHHRIKNSLQGVANLLWQQAKKHPDSGSAIEQAVSQVRSIATVYGLQGKLESGMVLLCELVPVICSTAESLFPYRVGVVHRAQLTRKRLVLDDEAVPLALVINELIFNAIKHDASPDNRIRVQVDLNDSDGPVRLIVRNHGSLPDSFDFDSGQGLGTGLDLVRALLPQRGARLQFANDGAFVQVMLELTAPIVG